MLSSRIDINVNISRKQLTNNSSNDATKKQTLKITPDIKKGKTKTRKVA